SATLMLFGRYISGKAQNNVAEYVLRTLHSRTDHRTRSSVRGGIQEVGLADCCPPLKAIFRTFWPVAGSSATSMPTMTRLSAWSERPVRMCQPQRRPAQLSLAGSGGDEAVA